MTRDRLKVDKIDKLKQERQYLLDQYANLQYRYHQVEQNVLIHWLRKRLNI